MPETPHAVSSPPGQPSLARRYMGKLAANIATIPMYLIMEAVLPRALGPQAYGNFNFATGVFTQFTGFLDMGTSTCFYNALSRRQQEFQLVAFYGRVSCLVLLVTLCGGCIPLAPQAGELLLPGVPVWYAPLAAVYGFLLWGTRVVRSMNDALGLTVPGELLRSAVNLLGAALLLALFAADRLTTGALFGLQYFIMGGSIVGCLIIMRRSWPHPDFSLTPAQCRAYTREFADYSAPLFVQALLSALGLCAERWMLQWFDGGVQQGYFALSQRVSAACFMFVSAMTPLVMRELAIAWGRDDRAFMGRLLTQFAPPLFGIAAWFSCFTLVEARALIRLFGGSEFAAALVPVQIMALYPAHQAYGQLASSVFHATGKTKILRNMAVVEHLFGLTLAWLLIAPAHSCGLGLGATGLALKTVITQMLVVNLLLYLASRVIPLRFFTNLLIQALILAAFLGLAATSRALTSLVLDTANETIRFLTSGVCYSALSLGLILACPALFGCSRQTLREVTARAFSRLRKRA